MTAQSIRPSGDFRTTYKADTSLFDTPIARNATVVFVALVACSPLVLDGYFVSLMIQIGYLAIAALGLNILVGFSGQISLGHGAFFGFGAFASAWINNTTGIPVFFAIPLAGLMTTAVGMIFGMPAARIKGLYLAIATLAAQFILEDFFIRAHWFTGGSSGSLANSMSIFGFVFDTDNRYFYIVLFYLVVLMMAASNLMRSRDGRALIAEIMGIHLTKYRVLAFGISSFYAGIAGALFGHYLGFVSAESFTILLSIQFLAMIIIGGLGSVMGSLLGTIFVVCLPEVIQWVVDGLVGFTGAGLGLKQALPFIKEMSIGAIIILFLIYEPNGLAYRWRMTKLYWKLFPFSY